jgi:hypothetical protein
LTGIRIKALDEGAPTPDEERLKLRFLRSSDMRKCSTPQVPQKGLGARPVDLSVVEEGELLGRRKDESVQFVEAITELVSRVPRTGGEIGADMLRQ